MTASASAPAQRSGVIAPYGGTLVDLMVAEADCAAVKGTATKTVCLLYTSDAADES